MALSPEHRKFLTAAGITDAVREARGYDTVTDPKRLSSFGFATTQLRVPSLLLPVHDITGSLILHQIRPDSPRDYNGRPAKYELPYKSKSALDVPPGIQERLLKGTEPVWVVDGILQADAAVSRGLSAVAVLGVEHTRAAEGSLKKVRWRDRTVYLAFGRRNDDAEAHVQALSRFLSSRGARVTVLKLANAAGSPAGLHRLLGSGKTPDDVLAACTVITPEPDQDPDIVENEYCRRDDGFFRVGREKARLKLYRLSNFTVEILGEVIRDDGTEQTRAMRLQSSFRGITSTFTISADDFSQGRWIDRECGASAVVEAGYGNRDHFLAAVRSLSKNVRHERVITHTGWRQFPEGRVFVHGGGVILPRRASAIHPVGKQPAPQENDAESWQVDLGEWRNFELVKYTPEFKQPIENAIWDLLSVGPDSVVFPMLAYVHRAVLGPVEYTLTFCGDTGGKKTSYASVGQQFFGPKLGRLNVPLNWQSTANSILGSLHALKDVLVLADDFRPEEAFVNRAKVNHDADLVLRSQANRTGRGRSRPDGTPRPVKPPRGALAITCEALPVGRSKVARLFITRMPASAFRSELDEENLATLQRYADEGLYSMYLHWFVDRLANDYDALTSHYREMKDAYFSMTKIDLHALGAYEITRPSYDEIPYIVCRHPRTRHVVAELAAALNLAFSLITPNDDALNSLMTRAWKALAESATHTNWEVPRNDPSEVAYSLLRSAFQSNRVHVTDSDDGGRPEDSPEAWGWQKVARPKASPPDGPNAATDTAAKPDGPPNDPSAVTPPPSTPEEESVRGSDSAPGDGEGDEPFDWIRKGTRVGWINETALFLDPIETARVLNLAAHGANLGLNFTPSTLENALTVRDRGSCRETESPSRLHEVCLEGRYREVLVIACEDVFPRENRRIPAAEEVPIMDTFPAGRSDLKRARSTIFRDQIVLDDDPVEPDAAGRPEAPFAMTTPGRRSKAEQQELIKLLEVE